MELGLYGKVDEIRGNGISKIGRFLCFRGFDREFKFFVGLLILDG